MSEEEVKKPTMSDEECMKVLRIAKIAARQSMDLCSPAITSLFPVITDKVPTMAVDRYYRMYVNPGFTAELIQMARDVSAETPCWCGATEHHDISYVAGVVCHEAWHPLRKHFDRSNLLGIVNQTQHMLFNIAGDLEINDDLMAIFKTKEDASSRLCLPSARISAKDPNKKEPGIWIAEKVQLRDGSYLRNDRLMEEYYHKLVQELEDRIEEMKKNGEWPPPPGDGSGGGIPVEVEGAYGEVDDHGVGGSRPWEAGEPNENNPTPGLSDAEGRMVRKEVAKRIKNGNKQRGTFPSGLERWADKELETPKYNWRRELSQVLRHAVSRAKGTKVRTYRRLSRRCASTNFKVIMPSTFTPRPRVVIVQDTSGSMSDKVIAMSMAEAQGILKATGCSVGFVSCDADAGSVQTLTNIKQADVTGGGGTDMRIGIAAALKSTPTPNVVILFTDGFTPYSTQAEMGNTQLIIGVVGKDSTTDGCPSWATVIRIDEGGAEEEV